MRLVFWCSHVLPRWFKFMHIPQDCAFKKTMWPAAALKRYVEPIFKLHSKLQWSVVQAINFFVF